MNIEDIRTICLSVHHEVTEDIPFTNCGYDDVAFRIRGKIFAYLLTDGSNMVVLKSAPERALELRENHPGIIEPAFHWNKKYWSQIHYDSPSIKQEFIEVLIREAFTEVVKKFPKKCRCEFGV